MSCCFMLKLLTGNSECYDYGSKHNFQTCNIISVSHGPSRTVDIQEPTKIARKGEVNDTDKRKQLGFCCSMLLVVLCKTV